jgi:ligand-binding sensor domain-containing protein/signal transduction histidine kinase
MRDDRSPRRAEGCIVETCIRHFSHNSAEGLSAHEFVNKLGHNSGRAGMRGVLCLAFALALLLMGASAGLALDPSTPLENYGRQSWAMESGLPQNTVQALAQTRDGFVWLGTEAGLVRFDGVSFTVFDRSSKPALPGNDIRCLLAIADGSLWIGSSEGLAQWKDGSVSTFTTRDGLPGNNIRSLRIGDRGELIVSTENGEAAMEGPRFVPARAGKLTSAWPASLTIFPVRLADGSTAQATASTVTLAQPGRELRWSVRKELPGSRVQALFADREGSLWIGTNGGLARWSAGRLELLPATDPLARASVLALMEDREGDLWVGTEEGGLHILRDQRFRILGAREGLSSDAVSAVVEDAAGTLWVGTQEGGLNALRRNGNALPAFESFSIRHDSVRDGLASDVILSLAAAPNGDLWVGTPDGLSRIRRGSASTYTSADGLPDDFIRSLLVDADGSLWIGTRRGLVHWLNGAGAPGVAPDPARMRIYTHANGLGSDLVGAMTRDAHGDLWVATLAGLSRLRGGAITNYTTADGLSSNVVTALLPQGGGALLIGTEDHGWDVWDGRSFSAATVEGPDNNLNQTTVRAILDDGRGHLWFATSSGIARCDAARTGATGRMPGCSHWIEFGPADELGSREASANSHPSAWRSQEGLLWFATPKGLVQVDPAHFPVNTLPPPVALERFTVDDLDQPPLRGTVSRLRVGAGHVHFEFDYAGLSFVAPQKVRYRYKLEGFDHAWTEAGARRAAYYTNIPPGRYTFRVQAANNDGVWNSDGATLGFELRPHFYQTIWFYVLLLAAAIGGVILLLRLRLLRAEREFRAVLGERSRIAREIHDTLAQGYVGISVQLELLAELLRKSKVETAQEQLDVTRRYVREGLADARQSIWALRTEDSGETTLPVKVRSLAEAAAGNGLESRFSVFGAYRPLPPETERELLRVAQEAIHNVKKHAAASQLHVQLEYDPVWVALEVRDNGRGGAAPVAGHFGLTGMRERAEAIGGTLDVSGAPGEGTTVRLRAPAPEAAREGARVKQ